MAWEGATTLHRSFRVGRVEACKRRASWHSLGCRRVGVLGKSKVRMERGLRHPALPPGWIEALSAGPPGWLPVWDLGRD